MTKTIQTAKTLLKSGIWALLDTAVYAGLFSLVASLGYFSLSLLFSFLVR
jgi:hypothetical protein